MQKGGVKMTAIVRRIPTLLDEVDRLANDFWGSWQPVALWTAFTPTIDIHEEKGNLVVKADLPGVEKDDVRITLDQNTLQIEAEKKQEEETKGTGYYARERYFGRYSRVIPLPFHVDGEKASASLKNGLLEIRLRRAEEAKSKHIEIQETHTPRKPAAKKKAGRSGTKAKS
jgi:HSP20 family protein